nr:Os03g0742850 [Ipomoea trifida]
MVAGPEVKIVIREPVLTKYPSRSPTATETATPVALTGRWPGLTFGEDWISSIAAVILNSPSDNRTRNPSFCTVGIIPIWYFT